MTPSRSERLLLIEACPEVSRSIGAACAELGLLLVESGFPLTPGIAGQSFALVVLDAGDDLTRTSAQLQTLLAHSAEPRALYLAMYRAAAEAQLDALVASGADDLLPYTLGPRALRTRLQLHLRTQLTAARVTHGQRSLSILLETTQALASSTDIQEILYTVVRRIADMVHVDRVSIVLVPDDSVPAGYVVAASDDAAVSKLQLDLRKYPEIRHVLTHKTALTIADIGTHPVLDGVRSAVAGLDVSSITLIPMVFEKRIMGVLYLRAKAQTDALDAQQIGFCQVLANATAIALKNARILQSLQDGRHRIGSSSLDPEDRLQWLKRYADMFESATDGIAALDEQARLLYANPGAYALLGYTEQELHLGTSVVDLIEGSDRDRLRSAALNFMLGKFPRSLDVRVRHKTGRNVLLACAFARMHGEGSAVLLSFRDVTEARHMQDELTHTRNFLQSLIDASVDAIVASDMRGRIILFNGGAERLYGYKREEVLNKMRVTQMYPDDGARKVMRLLISEERGGVGRLESLHTDAVDRHGNIFPISLTAATIYQNGKAVATFGIFKDLRERMRVEEQLAKAHEQLALSEKNALLAELAGATAHELNQPLTSVLGYADLLVRKLDAESPAYRAATVIQKQSLRMAEIVRKLGRLTRYETKSYVGEQRILDLDRASEAASTTPLHKDERGRGRQPR